MKIVFLPLSITSSWGNGHATNYRALGRALHARGHEVTFLERDVPWYGPHRDLADVDYARIFLYDSPDDLRSRFERDIADADAVVLGSYVPDGVEVGSWVVRTARGITAFFDIDTPVTLAKLEAGDDEYLDRDLVTSFDLYLSFTGGPTLELIEKRYGARRALPFYCMVDPEVYAPVEREAPWELGYLGTYSPDRQDALEHLMVEPARRLPGSAFCIAGPNHDAAGWPENLDLIDHLAPAKHPMFYASQRFTLNVTRSQMVRAGYSPSVRLFEAAACGVPAISDSWRGLDEFFTPGEEILVASTTEDVLDHLAHVSAEEARTIGKRARERVLSEHTAARRAEQLEDYLAEVHRPMSVAAPADAGETLQSTGRTAPSDLIGDRIRELAPWFHDLHLPTGHRTAPDHPLGNFPSFKWQAVQHCLPEDLAGWDVLDVGCNAGFYSFELARRGASVLAVDHDDHYLRQARWAAEMLDPDGRVRFAKMGVYDLARLDVSFDLVMFLGVLYHLRYPLLGLDIVAARTRRLLLLQTFTMPGEPAVEPPEDLAIHGRDELVQPGWPRMAFVEKKLAGDPTNWWVPDEACVEAMVRSAGLRVVARPSHEFYLCEKESPRCEGRVRTE